VLKQHATWTITIEGHCDERGSAVQSRVGERRALSARVSDFTGALSRSVAHRQLR
jgi:hypothetical protein